MVKRDQEMTEWALFSTLSKCPGWDRSADFKGEGQVRGRSKSDPKWSPDSRKPLGFHFGSRIASESIFKVFHFLVWTLTFSQIQRCDNKKFYTLIISSPFLGVVREIGFSELLNLSQLIISSLIIISWGLLSTRNWSQVVLIFLHPSWF